MADNEVPEIRLDPNQISEALSDALADRVVGTLNEMLDLDYDATCALVFGDYIRCNEALADLESVMVTKCDDGTFGIRAIGLLNSLCGLYADGRGRVGGIFENHWCEDHGARQEDEVLDVNGWKVCGYQQLEGSKPCRKVAGPRLLRFRRTRLPGELPSEKVS